MVLGNANSDRQEDIVSRWRVHPLLQTIRLLGFGPILDWLRDEGVDDMYRRVLRHRSCELCVQLLKDPELADWAMQHASTLTHRVKLAYALKTRFDENWLDEDLRHEAIELLEFSPTLGA